MYNICLKLGSKESFQPNNPSVMPPKPHHSNTKISYNKLFPQQNRYQNQSLSCYINHPGLKQLNKTAKKTTSACLSRSETKDHSYLSCRRVIFLKTSIMNRNISGVSAAAALGSFGSTRSLPRRGQIKARIAATALHCITSMLFGSVLHHQYSPGKSKARGHHIINKKPCRIVQFVILPSLL